MLPCNQVNPTVKPDVVRQAPTAQPCPFRARWSNQRAGIRDRKAAWSASGSTGAVMSPAPRLSRVISGPGRRGRREVRPIWCLDQQPPEGFERDVRTCAESAKQITDPSTGQSGSDVIEQLGRDQAELLGDEIADGQADHHVTGIIITDNLANRRRQERVSKLRGRSPAKRDRRMAGTVPAKSDGVPVMQAVQKIGANPALGQLENRLGVSIFVSGDPRQVRLHATSIVTTGPPGQAPLRSHRRCRRCPATPAA